MRKDPASSFLLFSSLLVLGLSLVVAKRTWRDFTEGICYYSNFERKLRTVPLPCLKVAFI